MGKRAFPVFPKYSFDRGEDFGKFRKLLSVRLETSESSESFSVCIWRFREIPKASRHAFGDFGKFRKLLDVHLEISESSESFSTCVWRFRKVPKA